MHNFQNRNDTKWQPKTEERASLNYQIILTIVTLMQTIINNDKLPAWIDTLFVIIIGPACNWMRCSLR